jgi:hypothetical protein
MIAKLGLLLGLALMVGLAYLPTLKNGYVYEDTYRMTPEVGTLDAALHAPLSAPRWLSRVVWAAQQRFAPSARAAHLLSLGWHLAAVWLLFGICLRLGLSPVASAIGAGIFALHPIQTEAVAYAAQRSELIAAVGVLLAVWLTIDWTWDGVLLAMFALQIGWMGKETAAVGLILIPLVAGAYWGWDRRWLAFGLLVGAGCAVGLSYDRWGTWLPVIHTSGLSAGQWFVTQSAAELRWLRLVVWPVGFSADGAYDGLMWMTRTLDALTLGMIAALALWATRHVRLAQVGVLWTMAVLLPRLFVQTDHAYFTEHQGYLALAGVALTVAALWQRWEVRHA